LKSDRPGDFLWEEWQGSGYKNKIDSSVIYYTYDHIDINNDLVRRALASALQRDGVAISLGDGFSLIEKCISYFGWSGVQSEEDDCYACSESGETEYGDLVDTVLPTTWIEI
jgi:hypothetical protein